MKMKGNWHQLPTGEWSEWPQTREDATKQGTVYFHPIPYPDHCGRFGHSGPMDTRVFTKTGINLCCARVDCGSAYDLAIENAEPTDPNDAIQRGYDYYWLPGFGKFCGHTGKRTIDGKCYFCEQEKINKELSPRQKAIAAGEQWCMPTVDDPCRSGHIALRRVNNGECQACTEKIAVRVGEKPIQNQYPDMVIDAETAKLMGFKAYRTGKPCKRGHTGWRYIRTKACIQCLRGE